MKVNEGCYSAFVYLYIGILHTFLFNIYLFFHVKFNKDGVEITQRHI